MKIEKLKATFCQQALGSSDVCGELADYRITTDDKTCTVTYCKDHALRYLAGKSQLTPVHCRYCSTTLKPGYVVHQGEPFCGDRCIATHEQTVRAYR